MKYNLLTNISFIVGQLVPQVALKWGITALLFVEIIYTLKTFIFFSKKKPHTNSYNLEDVMYEDKFKFRRLDIS